MAEQERLTKRERRERARRERREQELAAAKSERRRRFVTAGVTVLAVALVVGLVLATRQPPARTDIAISPAAVDDARDEAGCETVDIPDLPTAEHLPADGAPPAAQLYPVRPTDNGPHFGVVHPIGAFDEAPDERITTHNLEHGSVIAWFDPDRTEQIDEITAWAEERNRAGFRGDSGAGIIAAPFEEPLPEGTQVALRAWGVALNCAEWNETVADAFLIDNYGTHGSAPEASFGEYPEGVLFYEGEGGASPSPGASPDATATTPEDTASPTAPDPTEAAS